MCLTGKTMVNREQTTTKRRSIKSISGILLSTETKFATTNSKKSLPKFYGNLPQLWNGGRALLRFHRHDYV